MASDVEQLVCEEPWRIGSGQPKNAADPTWKTDKAERCGGAVKYSTASKWWYCEKCGCFGDHDFAKAHRPINDPAVYFAQSVEEYIKKRESEGVSRELATYQLLHIAGVAIRYASAVSVSNLRGYVEKLVS